MSESNDGVHCGVRRLFRTARGILRDDADAEDAVQDAYVSAYRALADFKGESSLSTWLTRIVVNKSLERLRSRSRSGGLPEDIAAHDERRAALAETPEAMAMRRELRRGGFRCPLVGEPASCPAAIAKGVFTSCGAPAVPRR